MTPARRWTMLCCALVAAMTTTCAVSGIAYLIPALHADHGMSLAQGSVLATIPTVGLMLLIIPWGALLDRYGERRILITSLCITLAGTVAAVATSAVDAPYWAWGAALFVGGLGSGAANGASGRIVVGWFPARQRGTAMGVRQMAQPLGIAVCALTMPVTAQVVGVTAALAVPMVVTGLGLLACIVGIVDPPAPPRRPADDTEPSNVRNPYRSSGFLTRVHGVSVLLVIPQAMMWTFVPTWLIVAHQWPPAAAGVLVTVTQVIGAIGRIVAGRVSDAWGSRMRPIRMIALIAAVATLALALTDWLGSPVAPLVMAIASIASVADNGLAFTAIAEYAGPSWSGRGLAIQNTAQYLATSASTPVLGAVIAASGFPIAFALTAVTPLIAIPLVPRDRQID
ncbi:MFS transporter [Gordonia sp. HNM0687]|uniref:MFS transporter n=2 Tax=Gordonia mangrovi TaxID=2665643 RepID=A0A6L7GLZ9_9ACTN|nr:MFS transporter [Gordonia mangrovi]